MADEFNRSEQATPKHREEARRRGQVARSAEVSSAGAIIAGLIALSWTGPMLGSALIQFARDSFSTLHHSGVGLPGRELLTVHSLLTVLGTTALWMGVLYVITLVVGFAQVGFDFSDEALTPKWSHLSPIVGIQRLLSWASLIRALAAVFKLVIIALCCKGVFEDTLHSELLNRQTSSYELVDYMMRSALALGWRVALATSVIAILDYAYQRFTHEKNLRMSREEIKEEGKQSEANPQMRGKIRRLMRQRHKQRLNKEVAKATVIITNPTHFAVALRYDRLSMKAPRVVGKGIQLMAQRIKDIARENNIPIIENKPLARGLYRHCPLGKEIPSSYFQAVAMVLAQVYRLAAQKGPQKNLTAQ